MDETLPHITILELRATGLTPSDIEKRIRNGTLARLRRGVYALPNCPVPEEQHRRLIHASTTAVAESNVMSHISAGVLYGLPVPRNQLELVTMTRLTPGHGERSDRLRVRHTSLADDEVTTLDGVRVTTLERTVFDLARSLPFEWGVMACDAALHNGLDATRLHGATQRHQRLRGAPRARRVAEFGDSRSESAAESLSRVQMARACLPVPDLQHELFDPDGVFIARSDFAWPELRLVGEVDGKGKYGSLLRPGQQPADAIMAEKRREESIRQHGFWIVRWDWDLAWRPEALASLLRRAMQWQRRSS
ncbi:type IV toxin-antitoxin system AbiEi family antitoxin domain-containing protein [Tessaracoccus sp.]